VTFDRVEEQYVPANVSASASEKAVIEKLWERLVKDASDSKEDRGVIAHAIWERLTRFLTHPESPWTVEEVCQEVRDLAAAQAEELA
jgi:hypothetical protein